MGECRNEWVKRRCEKVKSFIGFQGKKLFANLAIRASSESYKRRNGIVRFHMRKGKAFFPLNLHYFMCANENDAEKDTLLALNSEKKRKKDDYYNS